MLRKIIFALIFCVTTNTYSQDKPFELIKNFTSSKTYTNSNASLEFGVGYLFNPDNGPNLVRYQVASRNILLNKKLGFMYTIESNTIRLFDVFGLNYRISNNLSIQYGIGLASNVFSKIDKRKAISLAYHPDDYPFTITTGYSASFGPSLTVSYRISFYKQATE
ncbi:MAG: hypothetical protein HOL56_05985 [Flavobacteriales bacterium]|nr:hypothetical protein [Flavobacteriales bacterium]